MGCFMISTMSLEVPAKEHKFFLGFSGGRKRGTPGKMEWDAGGTGRRTRGD